MGLINQAGLFSGAGLVDQAGLYNEAGLYVPGLFSPLSLNPLLAYEAESSMLATGGGAAAQGDAIATLDDLSPNDIDATQTTANHQPIAYDAANGGPFARFDGSDDRMSFTLADPITNGTVFFATKKGSYAANLNLAAGTHDFSGNKIADQYSFSNDLIALLLFDYALTQSQIDQLTSYFVTKGAVEDYGAETNFTGAWRDCSSLTQFPQDAKLGTEASNVNFSQAWRSSGLTSFSTPLPTATSVYQAWTFCTSLESFSTDLPLVTTLAQAWFGCSSLISFSAALTLVQNAYEAWYNCSSLTDFSADVFANWNPSSIVSGVFNETWNACTSLTSQSVENILTSIDTSGKHATNDGTSGGTELADPVIDIDYDGSGLTAATTTAITNLKGKGWGITINGTLQ
jgi:hypothetical protein